MHKTMNSLPDKTRQEIKKILNTRLADAVDLYVQTKLAHWNVRGMTFIALHELFDKAAAEAAEHADQIAERVGQLGGTAEGNIQHIATTSSLPPFNIAAFKERDMTIAAATAWATFANQLRTDIDIVADKGDAVTTDILTKIAGDSDKMLWFIEAHLQ